MVPCGRGADRPVVVIVDGCCTAGRLPALFDERGYDCVQVQSAPAVPGHLPACFRPGEYREVIPGAGGPDRILKAVAAHRPVALVAGTCGALETADALCEALRLRGNGTRLGAVRRDRYRTGQALRAAGLRGVRQLLVNDVGGLLAWYGTLGGGVGLETLGGPGPGRRIACRDAAELVAAFRAFIGVGTVPDVRAGALLVREDPPGDRFHVNTVSLDGRHHVCDIWRFSPADGAAASGPRLGRGEQLPRRGPAQERHAPYAPAALDVLGVRNGPAGTELALTPEGPCLVAVEAHLCGGDLPSLVTGAAGEGQLEWTVDACVAPERFRRRAGRDYRRGRPASFVRAAVTPGACTATAGCAGAPPAAAATGTASGWG